MPARISQPRIERIDGRPVLVFDTPSPLPDSLATLLASLWTTYRADVRITGTRASCEVPEVIGGIPRDHRMVRFREGRYLGRDGYAYDLRLFICADCETVRVHDISVDRIDRLPTGSLRLRRRDAVIGTYTGARARQRVYVGL